MAGLRVVNVKNTWKLRKRFFEKLWSRGVEVVAFVGNLAFQTFYFFIQTT